MESEELALPASERAFMHWSATTLMFQSAPGGSRSTRFDQIGSAGRSAAERMVPPYFGAFPPGLNSVDSGVDFTPDGELHPTVRVQGPDNWRAKYERKTLAQNRDVEPRIR